MPSFGRVSKEKLLTCHPDIQKVMEEVIKYFDLTVLEGARSKETQREYVDRGVSKTLNSKHLVQSDGYSHAVDVAPYPIDWKDRDRFYYMSGMVMGIASTMGVDLVWGGDWNKNNDFKDQSFFDLPHFELRRV